VTVNSRLLALLVGASCVGLTLAGPAAVARPVAKATAPLADVALNSVSVVPGSTSAWAAGNSIDNSNGTILHRSTGKWSSVHYTAPAGRVLLEDVAAGSAHAAWVAGEVENQTTGTGTALLLHSTGGSFTPVSLPGTTAGVRVVGVAASSASNAWAIGNNSTHGIVPLAYRLVGKKWKPVALPRLPAEYQLESISTSSATNTWILAPGPADGQAALLHWNGKKWARTTLTAIPKTGDAIAISTSGPRNAWVVGFTQTSPTKGFSSHWNGKKWSNVAVPAAAAELLDVASVGTTAYAAGVNSAGPVVLRFSAGKWRAGKADKIGTDAQLHGVGASSKLAVAVGSSEVKGEFLPLIDVRSGTHWKRVAA
jgi:hypothetical protein